MSYLLLENSAGYFENYKQRQRLRDEQVVAEARQSLIRYMLLRSQYPYDIARPGSRPIHPRLLMLPCPDNLKGDKNLDGSQDPTCASKPPSSGNIVKDILNSGSRFGRLPWKVGGITPSAIPTINEINDGLGKDFRDSHGNRLWYVLSKNLAPQNKHTEPLNLHRLDDATLASNWLSVIDVPDATLNPSVVVTLSDRVAAVILAPGGHKSGLLAEALIPGKKFTSITEMDSNTYFEGITVGGKEYANHNKDGIFVNLLDTKRENFDDTLAYITIDELMRPGGYFLSAYQKLIGSNRVQNNPFPNSPLANMAKWLNAYYDFFEFYPTPAAQFLTANLTTTSRHCAAYHSGNTMVSAVVSVGATFLLPNTVVTAATTATIDTVFNLESGNELLAANNLTLSLLTTNSIVWNDKDTVTMGMVTVSRYARLRLADNAMFEISNTLAAGEKINLLAAATILLLAKTPLSPVGHLSGWLPEHYKTTMRASNNKKEFIVQAAVKAGFLLPSILYDGITITLSAKDHISLAANATVRIDKVTVIDKPNVSLSEVIDHLPTINGIVSFADGSLHTLYNSKPFLDSFLQRQYVVFLIADAVKGAKTVTAPAVLYPWREEIGSGGAITRDNLHPYPPCSDTRNFFDTPLRAFIEDQPTYYAVAGECHYGGEWEQCGKSGGLKISIDSGGTVALPEPLTLTQTYTATIHNGNRKYKLKIDNGALSVIHGSDITLIQPSWFPIINDGVTVDARVSMGIGSTLTNGETIVFAAQTPLIADSPIHFQQVRALLVYSPAPLRRTSCTLGMNNIITTSEPPVITVANQHSGGDSEGTLCRRMDNEENADGDGEYFIPSQLTDKRLSPPNDYFILFGGQATWN